MKEHFVHVNFRAATLRTIAQANSIIEEYQLQGYVLTLRQLYYQFVARDLIPNRVNEYKKLGAVVDNGRKAGLIDWSAIQDRTRNLAVVSTWRDPQDILFSAVRSYKENWWKDQPYYLEVWIEKDALVGVIENVCNEFRVPYFACRGYVSQSEMYDAGKRFARKINQQQDVVILHLGDHDPSGIDMTRDLQERLRLFSRSWDVNVERIALNMEQVLEYDPPPNPAKDTDSRFLDYQMLHGDSSWELDALEPQVISDLVRSEVERRLDRDAWEISQSWEDENRESLQAVSDNWNKAVEAVKEADEDE